MKVNISESRLLELLLDNTISFEDIDKQDKSVFIKNHAAKLLIESFKDKNFNNLEILFDNKEIQTVFLEEVKKIVESANINYLETLPENNVVTEFVWSMSRQDIAIKEKFFKAINKVVLNNSDQMIKLFNIRVGQSNSSFRKYQPIGLSYLRMIDEDVNVLIDKNIVSIDLFSPNTKDTIAHCLYQYSFITNKIIIEKIEKERNLIDFLLDKNDMGQTAIEKLCSDLRVRNIETIEYLFTEKVEIKKFEKDFLNYILKCSNIIKNKQTKKVIKERILESLELLFNMDSLQSDNNIKEYIAKNITNKCDKEVHYLWLSAKLQPKGMIENKKPKI